MRPTRAWIPFVLLGLLACCGGGEGPPEPIPEDPHKALLPSVCRIERKAEACEACVTECCAPCHPGSACIIFRACLRSCGANFACMADCARSHPEGERDAAEAELCVDGQCAALCRDSDGGGAELRLGSPRPDAGVCA